MKPVHVGAFPVTFTLMAVCLSQHMNVVPRSTMNTNSGTEN